MLPIEKVKRFAGPLVLASAVVATMLVLIPSVFAQPDLTGADPAATSSGATLLDVVKASGFIGYAILILSIGGVALVIDSFMRLRHDKLVPPALVEQTLELAKQSRFAEMLSLCKSHESMFARITSRALSDSSFGLEAVRETFEHQGKVEITKLNHRVGYIGFLASIAPMMGLLGTVTGMIRSFKVLGAAKGAARPDELAVGISEALVTTCMGLIVAVPLLFFFTYLRDRVTRIGQEAAGAGEKLLRIMAVRLGARQRGGAAESNQPAPTSTATQKNETST